ncbi:MAG: hypothetical protein IKJ02_01535 [Tidjanibacter sp.]|nr:hypothetical protein [Tidjanibacter sp.]
MAQANIYKCKPAGEVRVMTPVLIGSMVIAVIVIVHESPRLFAAILVAVLVVVAIVVSYLYMPRAVVVDDQGVGVKQAISGNFIPMESIRSVRRVSKREVFGSGLDVGVGGLFSYTGTVRKNKSLGSFSLYVRNTAEMVFIDCGKSGVVLSADSADELIEDILARKSGTTKL